MIKGLYCGAGALLLVLPLCLLAACSASRVTTSTPAPIPLPPRAASSAAGAQATDTPKPIGGGIQPPLSPDEKTAQSVATEFVGAVMTGRETYARSLMEPHYSAMVASLYDALGLNGGPREYSYQVLPGYRGMDTLVFVVVLEYPRRQLRGNVTLMPSTRGWRVTHIAAAQ